MLLPLIIALHAVAAAVLPLLARALGARAFLAASAPLVLAAAWALVRAPAVLAGDPAASRLSWVPALGIDLDFRLDALALAMVLLVSGVGAVIFWYSAGYFRRSERGLGRLAATMTLFAGAMLGVVTADNLFALYIFWELTSVTSFLLVGHDDRKEGARRAALQALLTTAGLGLPMLIGFVVLGREGGTYRISELVASPPDGPAATVALVLVLAGAFAKSAQVPLHYWLPGAMVAPTPVSAYLHAAAMVKGGVYLVARLAPGFADTDPWRALVLAFGLATMLLGGWRALRQDDLKLLLAYGTVSQLGFLMLLGGMGSSTAAVAAAGALLAHGLFKAALFLTVGVIDHQTGTRSIAALTGLRRRMPVLAVAAGAAAASMAGLPPLLGFVAKEAALEAFLPGHAAELPTWASVAVLTGIVLASVLTFAYSARFWWGAFAVKPGVDEPSFHRPTAAFLAAPVALGALSLVFGAYPGALDPIAQAYAAPYDDHGAPYHLALWHGLGAPLLLTVVVTAAGAALFHWRPVVVRVRAALPRGPNAEVGYHFAVYAVYAVALSVTRRLQTGSLPAYLGIILATLLALPGVRLVRALATGELAVPAGDDLRLWDSPLEALVAVVIAVTAIAALREHRRFAALILLSATGFAIAGLFVLHGAPDLALTLVLVETLTTVILVFVLRRLPATFSVRPPGWPKRLMVLLSGAAGAFVALTLWLATSTRTEPPVGASYTGAAQEAGGRNLVNTILADFRALDTFGEVVVLATAAVAVASLVLLNRRDRVIDEPAAEAPEAVPGVPGAPAGDEEGSAR